MAKKTCTGSIFARIFCLQTPRCTLAVWDRCQYQPTGTTGFLASVLRTSAPVVKPSPPLKAAVDYRRLSPCQLSLAYRRQKQSLRQFVPLRAVGDGAAATAQVPEVTVQRKLHSEWLSSIRKYINTRHCF